jgi:hypothetical protein
MSKPITFQDFLNIIKPLIIKRLNEFINNIDTTKLTTSITADLEYKYHNNGNKNINELAITILNSYGCKILSLRTLDNIFNTVLEDDLINDAELLNQLTKLGGNKTIMNLIKHFIFNSDEVTKIIEPYFAKLEQCVNTATDFINSQPYIEQKTDEWHTVRAKMISASTCGHLDSKRCKTGIEKEKKLIREKVGMEKSRFCGWSSFPLRHGQQFEDLTGDIYDTVNNLTSREYGILSDDKLLHIGASPDGIITTVNSSNFYSRIKLGRMREIKNPVTRVIDTTIPNYYYYQMQQQMYVCKLPMCDFIQTRFKYPNECTINQFIEDTMTKERLLECNNWAEFSLLLKPYLLEDLNYNVIMNKYSSLLLEPLNNIDNVLMQLLIEYWDEVSYFPLCNINKRGMLKGILWSFVRYNSGLDVDFKVEWLPITRQYTDIISNINEYEEKLKDKYISDGYILEETHYWSCDQYKVIEVEYNEVMYEKEVIPIINEKWDLISKLKSITNEKERDEEYLRYYPKCKKVSAKREKLSKKPKFSLLDYA